MWPLQRWLHCLLIVHISPQKPIFVAPDLKYTFPACQFGCLLVPLATRFASPFIIVATKVTVKRGVRANLLFIGVFVLGKTIKGFGKFGVFCAGGCAFQ